MPKRDSARGLASLAGLRFQTSRSSPLPPFHFSRHCPRRSPCLSSLHLHLFPNRLFSSFRFVGQRSFPANEGSSLSCLATSRLKTAGCATVRRSARPLALQVYFA